MAIAQRYELQWCNSVILDVAQRERVGIMFTGDMQDGLSVGGVTLINPFAPANQGRVADLLES